MADGFENNQFTGSWTSYKTNLSKKCNWGDFRTPERQGFDIGAAEFSVSEKYIKNGWENYQLAWSGGPVTPAAKLARQKENKKWWR